MSRLTSRRRRPVRRSGSSSRCCRCKLEEVACTHACTKSQSVFIDKSVEDDSTTHGVVAKSITLGRSGNRQSGADQKNDSLVLELHLCWFGGLICFGSEELRVVERMNLCF